MDTSTKPLESSLTWFDFLSRRYQFYAEPIRHCREAAVGGHDTFAMKDGAQPK